MATQSSILLVEDNADDADLTLRAFRQHKLAPPVAVVRDGAEALDYLFGTGGYAGRNPNDLPGLVLLDLKLPRIDGLEVLRRLRSDPRTQLLPVVILTSSQTETDLLRSYRLGCNSYVRKPIDFTEFMSVVTALRLYWLTLNEQPPVPQGAAPAQEVAL